jgi:phage terminase large subunit
VSFELPYNYIPRNYQRQVWNHFVPDGYQKRCAVIAHRRWGKDLLGLNIASCLSQQVLGTYWHVLPYAKQARAVVWNGIDTQNKRRFLDYFHPKLVDYKNEQEMRIHFKNGSIWMAIGGDDIDRHVGTNPIGVVLSEWALLDPRVLDYIRPILRENHGWVLTITTVRGRNHAWKHAQRAADLMLKSPNWLYVNQTVKDTLKADGTPVFGEADIQAERDEGMSEELIRQEYYNDPEAPIVGAYYAKELTEARRDKRIIGVPYDPKIPVTTAWDIGFSDFTVIIFYQLVGHEIRIIDCYANSGEEMAHYANVLRQKDYNYIEHNGPWDVDIKQLAAGGKSVYDVARKLGIKFRVMPQPGSVTDGIEQVRNIFPRLWFDERKCERLLEALSSYRKEPMAEKLQQLGSEEKMYKDVPLHDWTSHYADCFRVLAWSVRNKLGKKEKMQDKAVDNYSYV